MKIMDFIKGMKPTVEEQNCYYLLTSVLTHKGINKSYKLTNVSPGLATLIKRDHYGTYLRAQQIFLMNDREGASFNEIYCDAKILEKEVIKIKKGLI